MVSYMAGIMYVRMSKSFQCSILSSIWGLKIECDLYSDGAVCVCESRSIANGLVEMDAAVDNMSKA